MYADGKSFSVNARCASDAVKGSVLRKFFLAIWLVNLFLVCSEMNLFRAVYEKKKHIVV